MIRFVESFEGYATANLTQRWSINSGATINTGIGRLGSGLRLSGTASITAILTSQSTWIIGFALKISNGLPNGPILYFNDGGTTQCALTISNAGQLSLVRSTNIAVLEGTSNASITHNTWNYIEVKVTIADSIAANSCSVRLNGMEVVNITAGQNMKTTGNAFADRLVFQGTTSLVMDFDDLYVCDGSTDFLGDSRSVFSVPVANGSISQFTSSNYQNIDDTAPDGDTTYNETSTIGAIDLYPVPALTFTPTAAYGLQVVFYARKTNIILVNVCAVLRSGGTNYFSAPMALSNSYAYYSYVWEVDPATSTPWTRTTYEACEIGYQYVS